MMRAGRVVLAVLAGAAVWAMLWVLGMQGAQRVWPDVLIPNQPLTDARFLLAYIAYSVALSLLAGFVTAATAGRRPMTAVWILATLQLALGIIAEVSYWSLMPVWYHLVFLALIVPVTTYGGWLRAQRHVVAISAAP